VADIARTIGNVDEIKGRLIIDKNLPVRIHNQPAQGFDLSEPDAVILRPQLKFITFDDLQVKHPGTDDDQRNQNNPEQAFKTFSQVGRVILA
jgi:hypothetical protein